MMAMVETIGFLGLGDLGAPVAANLLDAGYGLRVWNRTASKADALVARGAERATRPADAASPGGIVVSLLWDDASVERVVASDDFLARLAPGGVHVSMSTITPEASKRLAAQHAAHGASFVEAPIFGRPEAAVAKQLWIPFAGPAAARDRVRPLLAAMGAQGVFDFGEPIGAATMVKLVGNFLIISAARSLGEGLGIAAASGYDVKATIDMLTQTLFNAPIYQAYGRMIAAGAAAANPSAIPEKDLGLFRDTARLAGAPTPISDLLLEIVSRAQAS
jgi:3-hydroxyisobutyrate dehydrogenase-like beta-hydroxyacid dehydrogenase